jgi:transposase
VTVTRYQKQALRCNACGVVITGNQKINKWEHSARSSIVLQKTHGMPFNRLATLQSLCGVPIAASTAWQQCYDLWQEVGESIYKELLQLAAQSTNFHIDDTGAKILTVLAANKELPVKERRACNTTTVCTKTATGKMVILYITANRHAGENFADVLKHRQNTGHYIRIIADASSKNKVVMEQDEHGLLSKIINASCLAHGRRKFTDLLDYYTEECQYFIAQINGIYHNEHECKYKEYKGRQRLKHHKQHSSKYVSNIYNKIDELFKQKQIEPNSALGKAMRYWLNNKKGLTKFLRVKDISLDNNWAERSLRGIILQRKNSLFFKSSNSAEVLSGLHSIVRTCHENGINSFGYLNWLQDNLANVMKGAKDYLPFAYAKYLADTELIAPLKQAA